MARLSGGVVLAAGLLMAVAGPAAAGPIGWSFSTPKSEATIDGIRFAFPGVALNSGESSWGETATLDAVGNYQISTDRDTVFGVVGSVPVEVTLTDLASGEAATFVAPYFGHFDISEDHYQTALEPDPLFQTRVTLGDNAYAISGELHRGGLTVSIASAIPPPATVPEPATALLAVVGLAGVGLARRGRVNLARASG